MIFKCRDTNNCSMKVVVKEPKHDTHQYFVCSDKQTCGKFTKAIGKAVLFVATRKLGIEISIEF